MDEIARPVCKGLHAYRANENKWFEKARLSTNLRYRYVVEVKKKVSYKTVSS